MWQIYSWILDSYIYNCFLLKHFLYLLYKFFTKHIYNFYTFLRVLITMFILGLTSTCFTLTFWYVEEERKLSYSKMYLVSNTLSRPCWFIRKYGEIYDNNLIINFEKKFIYFQRTYLHTYMGTCARIYNVSFCHQSYIKNVKRVI